MTNITPLLALRHRARVLWPANPDLQRRWLRAIQMVRSTRTGWHLDVRAEPRRYG